MRESLRQISEILAQTPPEALAAALNLYEGDERKSVRALVKRYRKKHTNHMVELRRLAALWRYEARYYAQGLRRVAGVDEAGRGPLAGPVVAAAVILPEGCRILGVNDSKQLSEKQRESLYAQIMTAADAVGIGVVSAAVIDDINIRNATLRAMGDALAALSVPPEAVLVDAETVPGLTVPQEGIIKGDAKSVSIAAASIIAKVTRDRMMRECAALYPCYAFDENKGYGSAAHMLAIERYGICPLHRKSFTTESKRRKRGL